MKNIIKNNKYIIQTIIKKFTGSYNEDLEQEVYIKTWKNIDKYKEQNKFKSWISAISANVCRDYLKSKTFKTTSVLIHDEEIIENIKENSQVEKITDNKQRQTLILKAVEQLPKKLKEVIYLYEFEEKTYEEISNKLKVPTGTIKSRLFNARKILSEKLDYLKGE